MSKWPKQSLDQLHRINNETFINASKNPIIIILDNVRSLMNVGSVFRTADAFRIEHLYLCGITGKPPHREMEKTALGATASVSWSYCERTEDAVMQCRNTHADVFAVEQTLHSIMLQDFKTHVNYSSSKRLTLIFGHEVLGVQQSVIDNCNGVIEIPQYGTKHSLNIAVSAGIVLWELLRTN